MLLYDQGSIEVHLGDGIEGMRAVSSVDAIITDPPYDVKDIRWHGQWFKEAMRIAKLVLFTPGTANLGMWLSLASPWWIACHFKPNSSSRILGKQGCYTVWEPILIYGIPYKRPSRDGWNIGLFKQKDTEDYPYPKSIRLWVKLVEEFTNKGDLIFDPFLGSGTTAIACALTGRRCIGYEIEKKWAELSVKRLMKCL